MSEQERHGQEPYRPQGPYAPYAPGHPADPEPPADDRRPRPGADHPAHHDPGRPYPGGPHPAEPYGDAPYSGGPYSGGPYSGGPYGGGPYGGGHGGQHVHPGYDPGYDPWHAGQGDPAGPGGHPGQAQEFDPQGYRTDGYTAPRHDAGRHSGVPRQPYQRPAPEPAAQQPYGYQQPVGWQDHPVPGPPGTEPDPAGPPYDDRRSGSPGPGGPQHGGPHQQPPYPAADGRRGDPGQPGADPVHGDAGHAQDGYPGDAGHPGPGAHDPDTHDPGEEGFDTEQFAFVEEENGQAEDVIDWLKFSESRAERRDERKRRGRARTIALVAVLALVLAGGAGYAWYAGLLPGVGPAGSSVPLSAQKRDVIVVHLREVDSDNSSTALLVRNETTGRGSLVLLPNTLSVSTDNGSTTLGKSVVEQTAGPTRDALSTLLGARIQGSWRLDTPYLEILVDAVGGITLDADATVTSGGKTVVARGKDQPLNGKAAVRYATYRGPGETEADQLARFGQVMDAVLMKVPSDTRTATKIVDDLGQVPDPSLSNDQLGATLAAMSGLVKAGHYTTTTLPVRANGTISPQATDHVVRSILGGQVRNTDTSGIPTVTVEDGSGRPATAPGAAQVQVVNAGYTYVNGGRVATRADSEVLYAAASGEKPARELAKTLGLSSREVRKGAGAGNALVTVVLGADYRPPEAGAPAL